jgi:hypothetical protein
VLVAPQAHTAIEQDTHPWHSVSIVQWGTTAWVQLLLHHVRQAATEMQPI